MLGDPITVLICMPPGVMRDSIYTLLTSFCNVNVMVISSEEHNFLIKLDQFQPDIILLDCSANYHNLELIRTTKNTRSDFKWVVITDNITQSKLTLKDGADYVLLRGFTRRELNTIIHEIFLRRLAGCNPSSSLEINTQEVFDETQ